MDANGSRTDAPSLVNHLDYEFYRYLHRRYGVCGSGNPCRFDVTDMRDVMQRGAAWCMDFYTKQFDASKTEFEDVQ